MKEKTQGHKPTELHKMSRYLESCHVGLHLLQKLFRTDFLSLHPLLRSNIGPFQS